MTDGTNFLTDLAKQGPLVALCIAFLWMLVKETLVPRGRLTDKDDQIAELKRTVELVRNDRDDWKAVAMEGRDATREIVGVTKQVVKVHGGSS